MLSFIFYSTALGAYVKTNGHATRGDGVQLFRCMENSKWSPKGLKIDDVALNGAYWMHKKSGVVEISLKKWNPFVTDEFSSETLILR